MFGPTKAKTIAPKTPSKQRPTASKNSLQVFCRIRPKTNPWDEPCVTVVSDTVLHLTPPESAVNYRTGNVKMREYSFQRVFTDTSTQQEVFNYVGLPLVEQLIKGVNGVLFTYGVTGSGKTFTMTGNTTDGGIMPRCLDVLFNTIMEFQTDPFEFKTDNMNGFHIQSKEDARKNYEDYKKSISKNMMCLRKKDSEEDLSGRIRDDGKITGVNEDNAYAVFVTYVEIYNNSVYDLLEDLNQQDTICTKWDPKIVRGGADYMTYVHGVTEVEVKSAEEAFAMFYKGQKRKRMANTILNTESSRSHSVFTIRLVQAPLDESGLQLLQVKEAITVSQLSLVDLAGSERTNRTNNTGMRLKEAGNINNSLLALRNCMEILRENLQTGSNKPSGARNSKLTYLFQSFFQGEGDIKMVVCVNPRKDDYDETVQVMKFAEMSQEIPLPIQTPMKMDTGLTPGRRKAYQMMRKRRLQSDEESVQSDDVSGKIHFSLNSDMIFSLGPDLPDVETLNNMEALKHMQMVLVERNSRRNILKENWNKQAEEFGIKLRAIVESNKAFALDVSVKDQALEMEKQKCKALEKKLLSVENEKVSWMQKSGNYESKMNLLKQEADEAKKLADQYACDVQRKTAHYDRKMQQTKRALAKCNKEMEDEKRKMETALKEADENRIEMKWNNKDELPSSSKRLGSPPVSNPRHGRTAFGSEEWLDHRPEPSAPSNTLYQPVIKKRKSVTQLTSPKQLVKSAKYCLTSQMQDEYGLETNLYKGDIVPTAGGGAQVILNDVETLTQSSPLSPSKEKKNECNVGISTQKGNLYPNIEATCSISIKKK